MTPRYHPFLFGGDNVNIVELTKNELINRSNAFYKKTKGTKDEYNMYEEHVKYVYKYILELSKNNSVDLEVLSLSAFLYDASMTDISLDRSKHNEYSSKYADEVKPLIESKYRKIMNSNNINEII